MNRRESESEPLIDFFASLVTLDAWRRRLRWLGRAGANPLRWLGVLLGVFIVVMEIQVIRIVLKTSALEIGRAIALAIPHLIYGISLLFPFRKIRGNPVVRWGFVVLSMWFVFALIRNLFRCGARDLPPGATLVVIAVASVSLGNAFLVGRKGGDGSTAVSGDGSE